MLFNIDLFGLFKDFVSTCYYVWNSKSKRKGPSNIPPSTNGDFLGNGSKDFDFISVIYGEHCPDLCWIYDIFKPATVTISTYIPGIQSVWNFCVVRFWLNILSSLRNIWTFPHFPNIHSLLFFCDVALHYGEATWIYSYLFSLRLHLRQLTY